LSEVRISGFRIIKIRTRNTGYGSLEKVSIIIIEQRISCGARRDNRLNPAIVGWEIPEKEDRKACSGFLTKVR
jgi:hypothetical protein